MGTRRTISPERKGLYALGLALQIGGTVGVLICFFGFVSSGFGSAQGLGSAQGFGNPSSPMPWFMGFAGCGIAAALGVNLRRVAARGIAGSGLVLDPERARKDLEPWARAGGGMLRDAIDETGLLDQRPVLGQDAPRSEPAGAAIKVRCRECQTLNDEDARYCDACGAKL